MTLLHSIRLHRTTAAIFIAVCAVYRPGAAGNISVKITNIQQQVFKGFGTSVAHQGSQSKSYASLSQSTRDEMAQLMWSDEGAGFRFLRLWITHTLSGTQCASQYKRYVDDARRAQPNLTVLQVPDSRVYVLDQGAPIRNLKSYASTYCSRLASMRDNGVMVDATGVANEPNDHEICRDANRMCELIRDFRSELDNRGLEDVKLIAPESGSVDSIHFAYLNAIKNSKATLDALDGVGAHSYNMGANAQMAQWVEETGLEYWQTEASVDESWSGSQQDRTAAIVAGKILCDLNNRVSYWLYFLGVHSGGAYGTKLIGFSRGNPIVTMQFRYMAHISKLFRPGAVVRYCEADKELPRKNMEWQYGQKPAICVAAAKNEDGSFVIGVANTTGCGITDTYGGADVGWSYPREQYTVELFIEELSQISEINFIKSVSNSSAQAQVQSQRVTMRNGRLEVTMRSRELICFESVMAVNNTSPGTPMHMRQAGIVQNCRQRFINNELCVYRLNGSRLPWKAGMQHTLCPVLLQLPEKSSIKHMFIR